MNATALIAEDEPLLAAELQAGLRALWPQLDAGRLAANGPEAVRLALAHRPDVLFLDVRMPGCTGIEAAAEIAEDWPDGVPLPQVVFVTAYDTYALKAFELAAADYVLKPVRRDRLAVTCQRVQDALAARAGATPADPLAALRRLVEAAGAGPAPSGPRVTLLQASAGATLHMVRVDEVVYFEAADKYVRVLTADREHLIRTSLRELLPQLDPQRFWQVHRGTVVRADAIASATRDEAGKLTLALRDRPERLPVSRLYAQRFRAM